jgi:hypothetical protein
MSDVGETRMGDLSEIFETFSGDDEHKSTAKKTSSDETSRSDPKTSGANRLKSNPLLLIGALIAALVAGLALFITIGVLVFKYVGAAGIKGVVDASKSFRE